MSKTLPKHIHFIGICGVAMNALAIAFHKKGCKVTGSDKGFYPPVSTHLQKAGIEYYPGWHVEKMTKDGNPDLVIVGNVAGSENPEWQYVLDQKIPYKSYPEVIAEYFIKPKSIVCAGTYGKTTSSTLMSWILQSSGFDPTYMFGGIGGNDMDSAALTESDWSIVEGDEYKSARWDNGAKFFHYSPTHLLLTSVVWDHADVYPTEKDYQEAFSKLVQGLPTDGLLVVSEKVPPEITALAHCRIVSYGKNEKNEYRYTDVQQSANGISFTLIHSDKQFLVEIPVLGEYMADNATGCFAMASEMGIQPEKILESLRSFKGIKRRLEKRFALSRTVFDDIAHSPTKAQAVLDSIRSLYTGKIVAVFEPNSGNREQALAPSYDNAFNAADEVIIPRLTKIKIDSNDSTPPIDGQKLSEIISKTHKNVLYIDDDAKLLDHLMKTTTHGDVIIFLGSHGFRGMIEELGSKLKID